MTTVIDLPTSHRRSWLEKMVFRGVVFNMSWEDPEMDRRAFNVGPDDSIISITSAGCNPLNLLCQNPARLFSIDGNPAQTALLELKLAAIRTLDWKQFFDIFAAKNPAIIYELYPNRLRALLSERSQRFWDRNIGIIAKNLYDIGRNGVFFRILRGYLRVLGIKKRTVEAFFEIDNLEDQRAWYYTHIAAKLWRKSSKWFVNFRPFMYLAGVHPEQFRLVDGRHDMYEYVKERVEYALTQVPVYDNYFWSIALTGKFRGERVPPYLKHENFETLRNNVDRVTVVNGWLGPFLDMNPAESITKFNLLDIFDWMSPEAFESTMKSVVRAARPGSIAIYRSGSYKLDPPGSIMPFVEMHPELARELLAIDRSATYGSFYVMTIKGANAGRNPKSGALGGSALDIVRHAPVALTRGRVA